MFLIRHGLSCCNVLHHPDIKYMTPLNIIHQDPYLTLKGIEQSKRAGIYLKDKIPKIDFVFSSSLIRSIETSMFMFPDNNIKIAPYICEIKPSLENRPYSMKNQYRRIEDKINKVNFEYICEENLSKSDFHEFIKYIINNCDVNENKQIAVISHSLLIMKILNLKHRMNNNCVFEVIYDTTLNKIESYRLIFSGYSYPLEVNFKMSKR